MLSIQNVTYTKCYLYKKLPIPNVTSTKCTRRNVSIRNVTDRSKNLYLGNYQIVYMHLKYYSLGIAHSWMLSPWPRRQMLNPFWAENCGRGVQDMLVAIIVIDI